MRTWVMRGGGICVSTVHTMESISLIPTVHTVESISPSSDRSHGTEHLSASNRLTLQRASIASLPFTSQRASHPFPPFTPWRASLPSHCSHCGEHLPLPPIHLQGCGVPGTPEEAFCGAEVPRCKTRPTESKAAPEHIPSVLGTSWCQEQAPCAHS